MNNPNTTVFVVDDDISVRKGLGRLLKASGYVVETFGSAHEFLQTAPDCPGPVCLILDVKMPGLSGLDLQNELQKREHAMPIVFITGHGDISMGVKAMKLTRVRGTLVAARAVHQGAEIFVTSSDGIVIRMETDTISRQKRDATGVKVMDVGKDASISSFDLVPENGDG